MPERFTIEIEQEADGRWLAEVRELPGCLAYGSSQDDAVARVRALALQVLADDLEPGEIAPDAVVRNPRRSAGPTGATGRGNDAQSTAYGLRR